MAIDIVFDQSPVTILNVYAPNLHPDRIQFFKDLSSLPLTNNIIILGDLNQVDNPKTDRYPPLDVLPQAWHEFQTFKSDLSVTDIATTKLFDISSMTRIGRTSRGLSASRIDYCLVSTLCYHWVSSYRTEISHISDHKLLNLTISTPSPPKPPRWIKVLPHSAKSWEFRRYISKINLGNSDEDQLTQWVKAKKMITKFASKKGSRNDRKSESALRHAINTLQQLNTNRPKEDSDSWDLAWMNAQEKVKVLSRHNDLTVFLQAGAQWTALGERPNRYFTSLYKSRSNNTSIQALDDGTTTSSDIQFVSSVVQNFYQNLYTSQRLSTHSPTIPTREPDQMMCPEEIELLTKPCSPEDLKNLLRTLPNRKSPGPDGLPYEIYKYNLQSLMAPLLRTINHSLITSSPMLDSGDAYIITLFKKGRKEDLKNWRPIALTNTDTKIFTKILAKRLGIIASRLVSPSQYGFIPNRHIWDNINTVNNIIMSHQPKGSLVFLDQEKAYDRVDWNFLINTLKTVGFPTSFLNWLLKYLSLTSIRVRSNSFITDPIIPSRGLRQGDPLSPILYNFSFDVFLNLINKKIKGISIFGQPTVKVVAFADDCMVALADKEDTKLLESIVVQYSDMSQASVNKDKTEIIHLGKKFALPWKTPISKDPVRHLGCFLTPNGPDTDLMEFKILSKAANRISSWTPRNLSLVGKVHLLNVFILSTTNFLAHGFPFSTKFIQSFNRISQQFLWSPNTPPVKIEVCYLPKSQGGMGLINLSYQSARLLGKNLINILCSHLFPDTWYAAMACNFARALNLPSPQRKHALTGYLASKPHAHGHHNLPYYWKSFLTLLRHNDWKVSFELLQVKRGIAPKVPVVTICDARIAPEDYPPPKPTHITPPKLVLGSPPLVSSPDIKSIWNRCFYRGVPPKWQSNTWKFLSAVYRTADRSNSFGASCNRCDTPDTAFHRLVLCPKAKSIWSLTSQMLSIIFPVSNETIAKLIFHAHAFEPNIPESLISLFLHLSLWTIHTTTLEEVNNNRVMSIHEIRARIASYLFRILYSYVFAKTSWPKRSVLSQINPWLKELVQVDYTSRSLTILTLNPDHPTLEQLF